MQVDLNSREDAYLTTLRNIDPALSEMLIENALVDILYTKNELLLNALFDEQLLADVEYFLYASPGTIEIDDVKYEITDLDSFMDYLKYARGYAE